MNKTYRDFDYKPMADGRILTDFPSIGQMLFKSEEEFRSYVDGYHATQGFFRGIERELRNAIEKHPKFCEAVLDPESRVSWAESEFRIKARNLITKEWYADNVLMEEVAEALATIPDLPAGWMQEEREWMIHKNPKKNITGKKF